MNHKLIIAPMKKKMINFKLWRQNKLLKVKTNPTKSN